MGSVRERPVRKKEKKEEGRQEEKVIFFDYGANVTSVKTREPGRLGAARAEKQAVSDQFEEGQTHSKSSGEKYVRNECLLRK